MLRTIASFVLIPPTANLLLILFGWLISRYLRRLGGVLIVAGVVSLWLLATPVVSSYLHSTIEKYPALSLQQARNSGAQAIIVLGDTHFDRAAEYDNQAAPVPSGLSRLHYAAWLHRESGLPLLTTGGPMNRDQDVHAEVLARSLGVYGAEVTWQEGRSATTWQNALFSADILLPQGVRHVLVVTQSYHMARAVRLFELAGFQVTAAPTQMSTTFPLNVWQYWMPGTEELDLSHDVLREYLGLLWYRLVSPVGNSTERDLQLAPQ
ncbi:MAG: YdcF family protein [Pseudomonadota bacterium]